jgi:phosphoglucomutase
MQDVSSTAQETEVQQLAQAIAEAAAPEFLQIARLLVGADQRSLFGETEFKIRDILLRAGATAYRQHLEKKKRATKAPA